MSHDADQVQAAKVYPVNVQRHTLLHLPIFYLRAILRPSARAYAQMAEYAKWNLVWPQLLVLLLIPIILGFFRGLFRDTSTGIDTQTNILFASLGVLTVGASILAFIIKIIFIPVIFFVMAGIQYLLARLLGGQGRFVGHGFAMLLYMVPLTFISGVIITVFVYFHISALFFAPLISSLFFFYGVLLNVFVVRGVHHLDQGRSVATVLIPYVVGLAVMFSIVVALAHFVINALH